MTVNQLIEILEKQDQNDIVLLSRDAEGNGYMEVVDWGQGLCYQDGYEYQLGEYDVRQDLKPCIVLWP